jgi:hypothetical protein
MLIYYPGPNSTRKRFDGTNKESPDSITTNCP